MKKPDMQTTSLRNWSLNRKSMRNSIDIYKIEEIIDQKLKLRISKVQKWDSKSIGFFGLRSLFFPSSRKSNIDLNVFFHAISIPDECFNWSYIWNYCLDFTHCVGPCCILHRKCDNENAVFVCFFFFSKFHQSLAFSLILSFPFFRNDQWQTFECKLSTKIESFALYAPCMCLLCSGAAIAVVNVCVFIFNGYFCRLPVKGRKENTISNDDVSDTFNWEKESEWERYREGKLILSIFGPHPLPLSPSLLLNIETNIL